MDVGAIKSINLAAENQQTRYQPAEQLDRQRRESELSLADSQQDETKVNPEEILNKIKEITQDGEYSVRFEKEDQLNELVVKVVDNQTEEVIRQIPPEAILGIKANLQEYASGNIMNQMS